MRKTTHHTPGPWKTRDPSSVYDALGRYIHQGSGTMPEHHSLPREEAAANARLIAAAPDLLEALKGMLEWARRVKVALDKAEGR